MPRLKPSKVRFPSTEVQGEGSFVEFGRAKWGAVRSLPAVLAGGKAETLTAVDAIEAAEDFICNGLVAWNWQDEEGNPLPVPKDRAALAELSSDEVGFLMQCAMSLVNDPEAKAAAKS